MNIPSTYIAVWLAFASLHSGLPIPKDSHPIVTISTTDDENHILGPKGVSHGGPRGSPFYGVTSRKNGHIFLYQGWANDTSGKCLLAHELTHYLQFINHVMTSRDHDNEPPAYLVMSACYRSLYMKNEASWATERAKYYKSIQ